MDCNFKEKKTTLTGSSYIYCGLTSFDMKCPGESNCIFFRRNKK
jgi:hypothetical protein